jgi:glycosyltransferase involved in cell wall biosynthesis
MRPLRLLIISSDTFPPTRVDLSVLFGTELARRGHTIDLILQSEADCAAPYTSAWEGGRAWVGATNLGPSLVSRVVKHLRGIGNDLRVFSRLRRRHYDAVEVKDKFLSGVMALLASRLSRTRFIYWLSYPFPEHYLLRAADGTARYPLLYKLRGAAFKWLLYRWLLPKADHVFVQSEQMRLDVAAQGIRLDKMTAVPMGVRIELCAAPDLSQRRRLLPSAVPCVLYLGTLNRVRRLDFLIRAFARVVAVKPQALLYIVGQGDHPEDRTFLENEAARWSIGSSVVFVGQLPQPEALVYVQESDVCTSPFYPTPILQSASPTKLVEYLAAGKPVVANDHPEQRRVIEDSGAGICTPYDEGAFAAAILSLLEDPARCRAMGERGRRYVIEHRSYGAIADLVERRLLEVVEGRCGGPAEDDVHA